MKNKLLLTISFIIFYLQFSFSQTNSFFLNNPVWQMTSSSSNGDSYCYGSDNYYNYYVNGDTVLNSRVYKKIYKKGYQLVGYSVDEYPPTTPHNYGCSGGSHNSYNYASYFLRSEGKKMYISINDSTEQLLYDFDLTLGDTLPITYNNDQNDIIVTGIDSIYTMYGYKKRFLISGYYLTDIYLVEGVGHKFGLVEPMKIRPDISSTLQCYSLNDSAYFPSNGSSCKMYLGIESNSKQNSFSVYPNPFNNYTTLQINLSANITSAVISNIYGQNIKTIKNIYGEKIIIDRENLKSGIYFVQLMSGDKNIFIDKLIITD